MTEIYNTLHGKLIHGDSLEVMKSLPADSIDLVVTSPPYADARKKQYGGVHPDRYNDWFLPFTAEIQRIIKPSGSFVLNIKEKVIDGERSDYVDELVREMRRGQGWKLPDKFIWHKTNPTPGGYDNRLKDAWEHLFWLTKTLQYKINPDGVLFPVKESTKKRSEGHVAAGSPKKKLNKHGVFSNNMVGAMNIEYARSSNVLFLPTGTDSANSFHPAVFPPPLPEFFIKLMTEEGGLVLDPFAGSCTTCLAAKLNQRRFIGIDQMIEYLERGAERLNNSGTLFDSVPVEESEDVERQRELF